MTNGIRSIAQSLRISARAAEQHLGISYAQLSVLQQLAEHPAQSINELADRTFTHQSSVSMVVSRLFEAGMVKRTRSAGDARRLSISLTPAGRAILRKSPATAETALLRGLRRMPRSEIRILATHLATLATLMADSQEGPRGNGAASRREARFASFSSAPQTGVGGNDAVSPARGRFESLPAASQARRGTNSADSRRRSRTY